MTVQPGSMKVGRPSFICVAISSILSLKLLTGADVEPIKLDLQDDYFVGEPLQVRLIVPETLGGAYLLLRGPDGELQSLLPNLYETITGGDPSSRKRLFPNPSLGYQALLGTPGDYRLLTVHGAALPTNLAWPKTAPADLAGIIRVLQHALKDSGFLTEPVVSTLTFSVRSGKRPVEETLPFVEGILDGPENPVFAPDGARLATTEDHRKIWRWAKLMNSPSHRHQSFLIECHANDAKTRKGNLDLSQRRADTILTYLVDECRLPRERLTATGKGDFEPLGAVEPDDPRQNRVTLVLDNAAGARTLR